MGDDEMPEREAFPFEVRRRWLGGREQLSCVAVRPIAPGERICVMTGGPLSRAEMVAGVESGQLRSGDDVLEAGLDLYYDLDERCLAFNHSCEPNAMLAGERDLVALEPIAPGAEITYDYATNISTRNPYRMKFDCACGATRCRRRLGDIASVPPDQLRRYLDAGGLQEYIRGEARALLDVPR